MKKFWIVTLMSVWWCAPSLVQAVEAVDAVDAVEGIDAVEEVAASPLVPASASSTATTTEVVDTNGAPLDVTLTGADLNVQVVGGDTLILTGIEADLTVLQALIDRLDRDTVPKDSRVVTLTNKNAQEVAKAVEEVMRDKHPGGEPQPQEKVTIRTISNNILLLTGPELKLDFVEGLIAQIDQVKANLPEFESITYKLEHVKVAEAKTQLDGMLDALRKMRGDDPSNQIIVTPLSASNSLYVIAPKVTHEKIGVLIDQIDVEPQKGFGDLKLAYFPLLNSDVTKLSDVLNELFQTASKAEDIKETIRRLSMVKANPGEDGTLEELPPINLERQIKLIPDTESQALICATAEENIEPLRALIAMLDGVPLAVEQGMRIFPLKYASVDSVSTMIEDMFKKSRDLTTPAGQGGPTSGVPDNPIGKSLVYRVGVVSDARTNVLIVTGRTEQLVLIEGVIQKVDVPSMATKFPLHLIALASRDATRVGKIVEGLWEKRLEIMQDKQLGKAAIAREKVFLSVELRSNSLIVSASDENFAEIQDIVQKLEGVPERWADQVRFITCTVASAADLKNKIDELWKRKADLRGESNIPQDAPVIVADQRSNTLVIASGPDDYQEIKTLVEKLESQPLAPTVEIRLLTLEHNDAVQVGDMLKQLFVDRLQQRLASGQDENPRDRVAIATESTTNTLLLASSKESYEEVLRIVTAIDVEPALEGVVKIFSLENAQAETVATKITELFDKGLYRRVVVGTGQVNEARQKIALVADVRSNSVIASASKANLSIIKKLIAQMDTDKAPLLNADTRIFSLAFADAIKLADMLGKLFDGMASNSGTGSDFKAPTIVPDAYSHSLIVTGSRDAIKRATDLIASMDIETDRQAAIQVYALVNASAVKLGSKIQEVFDSRKQGTDTQRTPVLIMPDEPTNTIICSASEEDHSLIRHLLDLLDVPSTISKQVRVFPLKRAKAEPTAKSLEELFRSQATSGGGSGGNSRTDALAVQPDKRTNSLVVWASQTEMENIAAIIDKLDTSRPGIEMMVKVIQLKRALSDDLSETLLNTLNGDSKATGADAEAVILSFDSVDADGNQVRRKLLRQDISIQSDPTTNSLFVMAPTDSMDMLESLILSIDRIKPSVAAIELFPLRNADAEEVVNVLTDLFETSTTDQGPEQRLQMGDAASATGESTVPGQRLRFTANRRTNMVIAAGAQTDLDMVGDLVRQLDAQDVEERIRMVYEARYIPAADMASAIKSYFDEENGLYDQLDSESSVLRQAERHVTIVSDEKSNSVLLGLSPRSYDRTMEMLYSVDRPPAQVMIEVLVAEVALDNRLEFGMEFALQDLLFSENATIGPNGVVKGNAFDFVGGVDLGAVGSGGGFNFSITGEDFSFLLHALQSNGSLEVLSHPTIMVENNEEATITIGDRVPFVQGSSFTDSGQTNTQVQYQDVGIILTVTPHINPDGYVNLQVKPEISALNQGSSVQISEGITAPIFTKRSVDTTVTVKDSESIVIGGLIQTQEDERETKMPIFGDLPIVGNLFRATQSTQRRTELLMVLTVNVVRDERDAYEQSVRARDQSGIIPDRIKRNPLMHGLRILPGDQEETYPLKSSPSPSAPNGVRGLPRYGPSPETYGPPLPTQPTERGNTTALETYGPPTPDAEAVPDTETVALTSHRQD